MIASKRKKEKRTMRAADPVFTSSRPSRTSKMT